MTTLTNSAEGGTSGTTVSAANSGGASGNAFDVVSIGTNAALTFDNTVAAHGTLSYKDSTPSVATNSYVAWTTSMGTQAQVWFRVYLFFNSNPTNTFRLFTGVTGTTNCASLQVTNAGKLQWINAASATILTSTATIPLSVWFRVEGFLVGSATVGQVEVKLFTTADGTVPVETDTSAATQNTNAATNGYRYGLSGNTANVGPFWMDDLGLSSTGYLGPAYTLAPGQPPSILRRTPARAYVLGSPAATATPAVFVAVPAPLQQPRPAPRRAPARAYIQFRPVRTTNAAAAAAAVPTQQPGPARRRTPARAYIQFTPVRTTNAAAPPFVPAQQFRTAPRRAPARAYIQFTPVRTTNAAPAVVPPSIPPAIPTSGGDRGYTIRVFREIRPGDVPASGAQLPKLTGRGFAMPVPADVEHVTHAWEEEPEELPAAPSGPGLAEQVRAELDELTAAARDAAAAIDRAADRARPVVEALGSKAYDLGKIFGNTPYDPRPRKVCGATRMTGGMVLTCQRKPHDDGWHSDKGLHWR